MNLAFYTCFYGSVNNYAFCVPQVPSTQYPCYYVTNNKTMCEKITQTSAWICIYDEHFEESNDASVSCMMSKRVKVLPHLYSELAAYDYLCFLDSKLEKVSESFVEELIHKYFIQQNYALLLRQHWFIKDSVWDEFHESMKQPRYYKESEQYLKYMERQIVEEGLCDITKQHCACGFIVRNMRHTVTREINEMWFQHIEECGIQDQISFFFVKQYFECYINAFCESPFC
jgi:hypothetical protein